MLELLGIVPVCGLLLLGIARMLHRGRLANAWKRLTDV